MGVALVALTAAFSMGCASSASTAPPATAAAVPAEDEAIADLIEHHRYHHHGGVMLFVSMSADSLGVSPEQETAVEKIRADLHARMEPARVAEQGLATALADGVAAAAFDSTKVDAALAQVATAAASVHDACVDALNALHAVLTPEQRAALVDKVESHWAVWQKVNAGDPDPAVAENGQVARLATELGLSSTQVQKIRADLVVELKTAPRVDAKEMAAHLQAFGDAFRGEKFDAKTIPSASSANEHLVTVGAVRMVRFVETVSLTLDMQQRATLAERLREHATHDPSAQVSP